MSSRFSPALITHFQRFHFVTLLFFALARATSTDELPSLSPFAKNDSKSAFTVLANGSIRCELTHPQLIPEGDVPGSLNEAEILISLALPDEIATPSPTSPGPQATSSPVSTVQRQRDEIQYTQTVFLTELRTDGDTKQPVESFGRVLLIQLAGRNLGSVYREARAELSLSRRGETLPLALEGGALYVLPRTTESVPFGIIDVPAEGVDTLEGDQLRFRGEMPPGTSGALTLKIPLHASANQAALDTLYDLEFDRAFRRAENTWRREPTALKP